MRRLVWYFLLLSTAGTLFSIYMERLVSSEPSVVNASSPKRAILAVPPVPDLPLDSCVRQGLAINTTFTDAIQARLPMHLLQHFSPQTNSLYFFADLVGATAPNITFKWFQDNRPLAEDSVAVGGLRWRVWSSIALDATAAGDVRVELWINDCLLHRQSISFRQDDKPVYLNDTAQFFAFEPREQFSAQFGLRDYPAEQDLYPVYEYDDEENVVINRQKVRDEHTQDILTRRIKDNLTIGYHTDTVINRRTFDGDTPLLEAIKANSHTSIRSLIEVGANPFLRDKTGRSPLDLAIAAQDNELRELLVHHMTFGHPRKSDVWTITSHPTTMLTGPNAHLKTRNRLGETHLMRAAASGDELAIVTLLGLGARGDDRNHVPFHSPFDFDYMGRRAEEIAHEAEFPGAEFLLNKAVKQFVPSWAILRKTLASTMNADEPIACHLQLNQPVWFVADLIDSANKELTLVWQVRESYKHPWIEVMEERVFIADDFQRVIRQLAPDDIPSGEAWEVHVELRKDGVVIPNGRMDRTYSGRVEPACKDDFFVTDFSLDRQYAAWVDKSFLDSRLEGVSTNHLLTHTRTDDLALYQENIPLLEILLEHGLDPYDGFIKQAVYRSRLGIVAYLSSKGFSVAKVNAKYDTDINLIERAAREGDAQMVGFLASQGISVNRENGSFHSPLGEALQRCNPDMVKLLLSLGANPATYVQEKRGGEQLSMSDYARRCPADTDIPALIVHGGS